MVLRKTGAIRTNYRSPLDIERIDTQTQQPQLTYQASVALHAQARVASRGEKLALSQGMLIVAEIHQGQRSVLECLPSPVQKVGAQAGRER